MRPLLLLVAVVSLAPVAHAAGKAHLTFAPRAGQEITQRMTTHTLTRVVGEPGQRDVVQESVTKLRYERTKTGWRVVATPVSVRQVRDGVEVADALGRAILGHEVVYQLGPKAEVEDVLGYEAIVQAMKDSLPESMRAAYAAALDPAAMKARDRHDFEARVSEWADLDVVDGDEVSHEDAYPLPTGTLRFHARTRVGPIEARNGKTFVTIRTAWESDSTAVGDLLRRVADGITTAAGLDSLAVAGPRLTGWSERVVDAATLDTRSEHTTRVIHMQVSAPGRGEVNVVRTEERTYVFEGFEPRGR